MSEPDSPPPERLREGSGSGTAMVLCGGLGTRLRAVSGSTPKVLVPVAGEPFLFHQVRWLRRQGVVDVVLCTGYGADQVAAVADDVAALGVRVRLSPEPGPLGTGGAVKHALAVIDSDPFLVLNGDSMVRADLGRLARAHRETRAAATLVLTRVEDRMRYGSVSLAPDHAVLGFQEKGPTGTGLINAGIYLLNRDVFAAIAADRAVSLEHEVFPGLVGRGLFGVEAPGPFLDVGTPESYALAQRVLGGEP